MCQLVMSKRSLLTLTYVFLLSGAFGLFLNIPGVSGWMFWKYNTGDAVSSVAVSLVATTLLQEPKMETSFFLISKEP